MSSPCLELTDDQKSWLVELIRGGTEVTVHEKLVPGLLEREPQLQLLLTQAGCFNIPNTKSR
jgi:hypothetical protein